MISKFARGEDSEFYFVQTLKYKSFLGNLRIGPRIMLTTTTRVDGGASEVIIFTYKISPR